MLRISLMWMTAIALTLATACSDLPDSVKSERQIANEIVECQLEQGGGLGIAFMGGKESVADCHAHCRPYLDPDSYLTPYSQPGGAPAASRAQDLYAGADQQGAGQGWGTTGHSGSNDAAQLHTESASKHCTGAHWGTDGLKPYMRYSLAGGYQANGENGSGLGYCYSAAERVRYAPITSMKEEIDETMAGWMRSPRPPG